MTPLRLRRGHKLHRQFHLIFDFDHVGDIGGGDTEIAHVDGGRGLALHGIASQGTIDQPFDGLVTPWMVYLPPN